MEIATILSGVIEILQEYLNIPVVLMEDTAPKPQYPFVGYKVLFHNADKKGGPIEIERLVSSENPNHQYDIEVNTFQESKIVLRLIACSDESLQAYSVAEKVINWFEQEGYQDLKVLDIVAGKVSKTRNKDIILEDSYERRVVLDVTLRVCNQASKTIPIIKQINFKRESEVSD